MNPPNPTPVTDLRPTRSAFKPAVAADLRGDLALAGVCLAGFLTGLLANIFGDFWSFAAASERSTNSSLTPLWLQLLVFFGFPLFLGGTGYFLWHAWSWRKKTDQFLRGRVSGEAVITHLWKEPPSGSGKKYYAAYRYHGEFSARQQVDVRVFKRLSLGQTLPVEYLPQDPAVSRILVTQSARPKR